MKCNQKGCDEDAVARFTWPGKDEAGICAAHKNQLCSVANSLGLYIQVRPIDGSDLDKLEKKT